MLISTSHSSLYVLFQILHSQLHQDHALHVFIDALANTFAKDLIKNNMVAPPTTAAGDQPFAAVASVEQGEEENSVVVRNLKFSFPTSGTIIEDFSLTVPRGGRVLLAGANGAGKTTTIKMIMGLAHPDKGQIKILGKSNNLISTKRKIGFMPENPYFYNYLISKFSKPFFPISS